MKYFILIVVVIAVILTTGCTSRDISNDPWSCGNAQYTWHEKISKGIGCCNGTVYNLTENSCCTSFYPLTKEVIYDGDTQRCCNGVVYNRDTPQDCCNYRTLYNTNTQGCCRFDVYNKDIQGCCVQDDYHQVIFNKTDQHCCNRTVVSGGGMWDTCGSQCYNMDTQSCCNGEIKDGVGACPQQGGGGSGDYASICSSFGEGSAACSMAKQNDIQRNARLICPSCRGY
jgi:hypothetical protein